MDQTSGDSILHTYFVDAGTLRFLRNCAKRAGYFRAQRDPKLRGTVI